MRFRWVKRPRGRSQHSANGHGNRRGIRFERAGKQLRVNYLR